MTHEREHAIQELRRQAEEQPEIQQRLWKRQLSQQSTYKADIHELYTEMLNMQEKSEMPWENEEHQGELDRAEAQCPVHAQLQPISDQDVSMETS